MTFRTVFGVRQKLVAINLPCLHVMTRRFILFCMKWRTLFVCHQPNVTVTLTMPADLPWLRMPAVICKLYYRIIFLRSVKAFTCMIWIVGATTFVLAPPRDGFMPIVMMHVSGCNFILWSINSANPLGSYAVIPELFTSHRQTLVKFH